MVDQPSKRVALVVGNANYKQSAPLRNPHNDADLVAATLNDLNFKVHGPHKDVDFHGTALLLGDFSVAANDADMAIIYFAGHGLEIDGKNYLLPADAKLENVLRVHFETIKLDDVLLSVDGAKALRLVILDACRDNPFVTRMRGLEMGRSAAQGFSRVEPPGNTLVAYAAKHGTRASDGRKGARNSPYAEALCQHLKIPDLELRLLFGRVRDAVYTATGRAQEPFLYGALGGEQIFLKRSEPAQAQSNRVNPVPIGEGNVEERAAKEWTKIEQSLDDAVLQIFEEHFAGTYHARLAGLRRRKLQEESQQLAALASQPPNSTAAPSSRIRDSAETQLRTRGYVPVGVGSLGKEEQILWLSPKDADTRTFRDINYAPEMVLIPRG